MYAYVYELRNNWKIVPCLSILLMFSIYHVLYISVMFQIFKRALSYYNQRQHISFIIDELNLNEQLLLFCNAKYNLSSNIVLRSNNIT